MFRVNLERRLGCLVALCFQTAVLKQLGNIINKFYFNIGCLLSIIYKQTICEFCHFKGFSLAEFHICFFQG